MRPTKEDYDRYLWLVKRGRDLEWNEQLMSENRPFEVADPTMTFILLRASRDLLYMAEALNFDGAEISEWCTKLSDGIESLRNMSDELNGEITLSPGLGPFEVGLGLQVHRGTWSDGDVVSLHLPGIVRDDLSLRSESGTVYVGINSREHPVPFSRPAKASQVNAKLENEVLKLTFPSE